MLHSVGISTEGIFTPEQETNYVEIFVRYVSLAIGRRYIDKQLLCTRCALAPICTDYELSFK